ncbi:hypothetical protein PoB_006084200 [Plakobranchus ocellatus]|uniref:Uncharacterized protein n=1 Tax=Plakobranchus ocellatus TaxID=259542 RepID=A0AAV4CR16_9GAST|nr:hypothetical protein PoB_006084200 [Plakobranchus ocellatus]
MKDMKDPVDVHGKSLATEPPLFHELMKVKIKILTKKKSKVFYFKLRFFLLSSIHTTSNLVLEWAFGGPGISKLALKVTGIFRCFSDGLRHQPAANISEAQTLSA